VSETTGVCVGEEVAEVQVYSSVVVIAKPEYIRVVRYSTVEIEKAGGEWVRVRVYNLRGEAGDYCAKRFSVHPFSVPTPLAVTR
jgi:hypothetical protein